MAGVVLAVAKGTLAIFPGFPPMDRRQPHQEGIRRQSLDQLRRPTLRQNTALLQAVIAADIVIEAGLERRQWRQDGVTLGGMEVAAAGIAAQGPAVAVEL